MFDLQHRQDNGIPKVRRFLKFAQFEIKGTQEKHETPRISTQSE
jgi:hypothetical protein